MNKKSFAITGLGGAFIFIGILLFLVFLDYVATDISKTIITAIESGNDFGLKKVSTTHQSLRDHVKQKKLLGSAHMEQLEKEIEKQKQELISKLNNFTNTIKREILITAYLCLICSIVFIVSATGLLMRHEWGRITAMCAISLGGLLYIQLLRPIYSLVCIGQYAFNETCKLIIMADPSKKTPSDYVGSYFIKKMFIGLPYVIVHGVVFLTIVGLLFWLASPRIKKEFESQQSHF